MVARSKRRRRVALLAAAAAVGVTLPGPRAFATDYSWGTTAPTASGNWGTSTSWTPNGVPGSADRAIFSVGGGTTAPGTVVTLNGDQAALALTFSNATGSYQIVPGAPTTSTLTIGSEGITQSGASTAVNEITARLLGTSGSAWTFTRGHLRLANTAVTAGAQNDLTGVTINLSNPSASTTAVATLSGLAAGTAVPGTGTVTLGSSLGGTVVYTDGAPGATTLGAAIDITGSATTANVTPVLNLRRTGATGAGVFANNITIHGGANLNFTDGSAAADSVRLHGAITLDSTLASNVIRIGGLDANGALTGGGGGARHAHIQSSIALSNPAATSATTFDVATSTNGAWTFLNGQLNFGANTINKAGSGELQIGGAIGVANTIDGTININAGVLVVGSASTYNPLDDATIAANGGGTTVTMHVRPILQEASTPMNNAVLVQNGSLTIDLNDSSLTNYVKRTNVVTTLGNAATDATARPLTLGNGATARTLNLRASATPQHDLTIARVVLAGNGTLDVDVGNDYGVDNYAAAAADRNIMRVGVIDETGGPRNFTKSNVDTLFVDAASYTGTTTVTGGVLIFSGNSALGTSSISATGGTVRLPASTLIGSAPAAKIGSIVNARLDLGYAADLTGFDATKLPATSILRLGADQATVAGGAGILPFAYGGTTELRVSQGAALDGNVFAGGAVLRAITANATYAGDLSLQGNLIVQGGRDGTTSRTLTISGVISNNGANVGSLTKTNAVGGTGTNDTVTLSATNTYTGATTVSRGTLNANAANAIPANTTLNVDTAGNVTVGSANALNNVTVNITQAGFVNLNNATPGNAVYSVNGGTLRAQATNATFGGNAITLNHGRLYSTANATYTGPAITNIDTGVIHVNGGTANYGSSNLSGSPINANAGFSNFNAKLFGGSFSVTTAANITSLITGTASNTVNYTSTVGPAHYQLGSDAEVGAFFGNTEVANNNVVAAGTNNQRFTTLFTGTFTPRTTGLHFFGGGETTDDVSTIWVDLNNDGDVADANEKITEINCCNDRVGGTVTLNAGTAYTIYIANQDTGGGGSTSAYFGEPGSGYRTISPGLRLGGGQIIVDPSSTLQVGSFSTFSRASLVGGNTTGTGATLRVTAADSAVDEIAITGRVGFTAPSTLIQPTPFATVEVQAAHTLTTVSLAAAVNSTLAKSGTGTLSITSSHNLGSGTVVQVNAGRLAMNSTAAGGSAGRFIVNTGGTLGGSGTISGASTAEATPLAAVTIAAGGTLAPGNSAGILTVTGAGSAATPVVQFTGGTYAVELSGTTPGTDYDQLRVTGANGNVALGSAVAALSVSGSPIAGQSYTIIDNTTAGTLSGGFSNVVTDGSQFSLGGFDWTASNGDGNDLVLTAVPEPGAVGVLALSAMGLLVRRRRRHSA